MECDSLKVEWASVNLGIFLCESCSGRHRALGTHVSQVRSLWLDSKVWTDDIISKFRFEAGNARAKAIYQARVPSFAIRPPRDRGPIVMENWLRNKYELKQYTIPTQWTEITSPTSTKSPDMFLSQQSQNTNTEMQLDWKDPCLAKMPMSILCDLIGWRASGQGKESSEKSQYFVLHGRWLSRYSSPKNSMTEQRIDLTTAQSK